MQEVPPEEVGNEGALESSMNSGTSRNAENSVATLSSPWEFDELQKSCTSCKADFGPINRRHHCRLCGKIFCNNCSKQRALIPPSSIVLVPAGGKKAKPRSAMQDSISFSPDQDPDRMLTYLSTGENKELLYGRGLEERFKLAREPLRVCQPCYRQLEPMQADLRNSNSNAMRFNHIDPTDARRLFNSPLAFTLGHEIRKAAYTLSNLLPQPKRMGAVLSATEQQNPYTMNFSDFDSAGMMTTTSEIQHCKETCSAVSPNLGDLDGVRVPARLLEQARGIAVMTVVKGGFGLAGVEFGTGLVVARLGENRWSAPSAIGTAGLAWGALVGAQVSDHVFVLMNDAAVEMLFNDKGSVQLGADVGVALGPVGRALEADLGAAPGSVAPIYTYSLSKGLYAGISLDGKVVGTREHVNEKFYGRRVSGREILAGAVPTPPAAAPLYEALQRCHVYAGMDGSSSGGHRHRSAASVAVQQQQQQQQQFVSPNAAAVMGEYGEVPPGTPMPPAPGDQHSHISGGQMSEVTFDPGY